LREHCLTRTKHHDKTRNSGDNFANAHISSQDPIDAILTLFPRQRNRICHRRV
jgi:hypothetical protein